METRSAVVGIEQEGLLHFQVTSNAAGPRGPVREEVPTPKPYPQEFRDDVARASASARLLLASSVLAL